MKRFARYAAVAALVVALAPVATIAPAGAIPGAPVLTAPNDGATASSNPVFAWGSVLNATNYRVQVSANASFTPLLVNVLTVNTKYGHPTDLPLGVLHWRVAAIDGGGQGDFSIDRTFTKEAPAGPDLSSPADGATLDFPTDPPVFSWQPYVGAKRYEIEIDNEPGFTPPLTLNATSTVNNSYALTAQPSLGQTFYWRVRSFSPDNQPTQYSDVRSYSFAWPTKPELEYPPDDNSPTAAIEEVVFQWTPTQGAVSYELQVSPTDQFTALTPVGSASTIKSTQYSPPNTIDNGAYFWRVRARTTTNAVGDWSEVSTFYRAWPADDSLPNSRVELVAPADLDVSVGLPEYSWTPVRLASTYSLEVGTDPLFSPGSYDSCPTQHTSFVPVGCGDPTPGVDYYWRVKPLDAPANINGLYSETWRFQYNPGIPALLSPADGASGLVAPVELRWSPVHVDNGPDVARYKVTILADGGTTAETATTYATGYVPQQLDPADGPFSWYVQIVTATGNGILPGSGSWRTFSFEDPSVFGSAPDPITPDGTSGFRVPHLEWEPMSTATSYEIWTALAPSTTYTLLRNSLEVPGYTDVGTTRPPGSYTYFIRAKNSNVVLADGAVGTFNVTPLGATNLTSPDPCDPDTACPVEPTTPTLEWDWDPQADHYRIYLAADPNFTNILGGYNGVNVHYPRYRPTVSLPDAQAGQATYWYARPCYGTSPEVCGAEPGTFGGVGPIRAFLKRSNQVQLVSPADQAPADAPLAANQNQVTFDWVDFLETNLAAPGALANGLEARNYRVQVSTTIDMQTVIHTSPLVDQTTYTAYSATLPDGPLYWRVQAIDASGNFLSFSEVRLVHKKSPVVSLLSPTPGATVPGVPVFTWEEQRYAARYSVEVYRNPGQPLAPGNRVLSVTTPMTGWTPTTALTQGTYGWRVQRLDVDSRPGPWSATTNSELRLFTVAGNQVNLLTPVNSGNFVNNNQSFTWSAAVGAAQYRIETSPNADFSGTLTEGVTTALTSWHSTKAYPNGTYHWRVHTIDGGGNTTATSSTRTFSHGPTPPSPVYFHPVSPARILDSRAASQVGPYGTPWTSADRHVPVAGFSGVPAGADAVALNVTVTGTTAGSYLRIWPKGQAVTTTSSVNWSSGSTVANAVTMGVGADESVTIRNAAGAANIIIDVVGYYDSDSGTGGGLTPLTPRRVIDSRPGSSNLGPYASKWGAGQTRDVVVATGGAGMPPADADAVVLNVTALGGTQASFLTVWPKGESKPTASSLNFKAAQTVANAVTAKVGDDGSIRVFNNVGSVDVIVDVVGYFEPGEGAPFRPLPNPIRIQDSRPSLRVGAYSTKWGGGTDRTIAVVGPLANVPQSAVAALLNVTVVGTTGSSYLTVYPQGAARPTASSVNWSAGQTVANSVTTGLGSTPGGIRAFNQSGQTDVIVDISGYYGP